MGEEAEEDLVDTEQVSEVEKILQDLASGVVDKTLPQLTEDLEDDSFEMDEVVVEEEEIVDDDDDDENDIGWINDEEQQCGSTQYSCT